MNPKGKRNSWAQGNPKMTVMMGYKDTHTTGVGGGGVEKRQLI